MKALIAVWVIRAGAVQTASVEAKLQQGWPSRAAEAPSRQSRESVKMPSRSEWRVAHKIPSCSFPKKL
jgi:hypothetical protein